jgi:glycosyltransferase involved in cell wall biosynthesis
MGDTIEKMHKDLKQEEPRIQILLATYNGAPYLAQQISSLLDQTYTNWELLISDDGSTDTTTDILHGYEEQYSGKIRIIGKDKLHMGACANFFYLLGEADAEYVMFCDQDDYWEKEKIEISLKEMRKAEFEKGNQIPILVFTDLNVVDSELNTISDSYMKYASLDPGKVTPNRMIIQNIVTGCTTLMNRKLCDLALMCRDSQDVVMHDWWVSLVASCMGELRYINKSTIRYRQHGENTIGVKNIYSISFLMNKIFKNNNMRSRLKASAEQAGKFIEIYGDILPVNTKKLFSDYSKIYKLNKFKRIHIFCRYGTRMHSLARKVGQLIYG